ncbi:factor of DNA methylation 2-like [Lotus japonicus]|uniref:factor of DNA methylation 2-like n=1 Tax=Lotus japonicus TaxID=34305 RepID=UPI0025904BEE|nr:factor of DNA methylation 2-like [Lotus japonicus]
MRVKNSKMNHDIECLKIENWRLSKQLEDSKALNDQQEKNFIEEIQKSLKDMFRGRSQLGIKRMGELDPKPFQTFCSQKYSCEQWQDISAKLCSSWEENLKDSAWHPFKTIEVNVIPQVVFDENDEKLKGLKNECGEVVYKAVENALMEMEEYNSSGRYAILEIWNWKEGRKATLKEIIQFIIRKLKIHKLRESIRTSSLRPSKKSGRSRTRVKEKMYRMHRRSEERIFVRHENLFFSDKIHLYSLLLSKSNLLLNLLVYKYVNTNR